MSTRSRIGVLDPDNRVRSIYCHFDGYPTGVGAKLRDNWTNPGRVEELIALGDLSALGSIIGSKHSFDNHYEEMRENGTDWCLFYDRDRGEQNVGHVEHPLGSWPDYGQEWEYLFSPKEREWICRPVPGVHGEWQDLAAAIAADEAEQAAWKAEQEAKRAKS